MDPRLSVLTTRARAWDDILDWCEEPDEISLEIIPPTHWPETCGLTANMAHASAGHGDGVVEPGTPQPELECRALAILANALRRAVRAR